MRFKIQAGCAALALTIPTIGCTACRTVRCVENRLGAHAIFNPVDSPVALADFDRSDWPVAYMGDAVNEETLYDEYFVDIQGRGFNDDDGFLFRRFQSNRFGRWRR